jgi:hypothetical protein
VLYVDLLGPPESASGPVSDDSRRCSPRCRPGPPGWYARARRPIRPVGHRGRHVLRGVNSPRFTGDRTCSSSARRLTARRVRHHSSRSGCPRAASTIACPHGAGGVGKYVGRSSRAVFLG